MTDNQTFASPKLALAHYGVKGMQWGKRKSTIQSARSKRAELGDASGAKEQAYLKARKKSGENSAETQKAKADLQKAYKAEKENDLVAKTLTRGEQIAATILAGPIGALAVAGNRVYTRDGKQVSEVNIDKLLRGVDPEDD